MKKLFTKVDKVKALKQKAEKENQELSSMPSYMLDVIGKNLGTTKTYSEETIGEKSVLSNSLSSVMFEEQLTEQKQSGLGNIFSAFFNR